MSRSNGWDRMFNGIVIDEDCEPPNPETGFPGNCGSETIGTAFMFTYLVVVTAMTLMMYAVILYNYLQLKEDATECPCEHELDTSCLIWQQFDSDGTQQIRYGQMSEFIEALDTVLQVHKHKGFKILFMGIPMTEGQTLCKDIIEAITENTKARESDLEGEQDEGDTSLDEINKFVSSMFVSRHKEHCARLIQRAWRKHKQHKYIHYDETGDENETESWTLLA